MHYNLLPLPRALIVKKQDMKVVRLNLRVTPAALWTKIAQVYCVVMVV